MSYGINLTSLKIDEYKQLLKKQNLLPSRRLLWDGIDEKFAIFAKIGIKNVKELLKLVSDKKATEKLVSGTLTSEYLTILKRELGTLVQKPILLSAFPDVDKALVGSLIAKGIKTTKDYYETANHENNDYLYALSDLVRINGVGPLAAMIFVECGYPSVASIARADALVLLKQVNIVNGRKQYYKGNLGEKDMHFCIDYAQLLVKYADK